MDEIRAFVGHSFAEDDASVVGKFLKYFDTISKLHPAFSWEHAEAAEPKLLSEKVMSLISNKNTFIGICTRSELAVREGALSKIYFQPTYRKASESSLEWKTSDWIIQEIGMAKARNLEIILLIEDGLRRPGGLQGDVEHILFNRNAPEKSFAKILEMITALSPAGPNTASGSGDTTSTIHKEETPSPVPADDTWKTPSPDWKRADYEHAMFRSLAIRDTDAASRLNDAYLSTSDAAEGENRYIWAARNEWLRILFGAGGGLSQLKALAADHPTNRDIRDYLARGLGEYEDHVDSAKQFEAAAHMASDRSDAMRLMGSAAVEFAKAGAPRRVAEIVRELKRAAMDGIINETEVLPRLRELAEIHKRKDLLIVILERMIELTPDDNYMRFSLAYQHSEVGNHELALANYMKISYDARNAMMWNNLGVAFDHFQLRDKSVRAYQKAEEMGETLAMSNLGYKLLRIGMTREAQAKCDKAFLIKDYHKNVVDLLSKVKGTPEEEEKKLDDVLDKAKPKSEFYGLLAQAILHNAPSSAPGSWLGPNGPLEMSLTDDELRISGTYEVDANPFAVLGGLGIGKLKVKHRVEYFMTLAGHAMFGVVKRIKEGEVPSAAASALALGDNETKVLMVLGDNETRFRVMENPYSSSPTFYSITQSVAIA
jgi:tetratricopeptide (TPR) repeat protein